MEYSLTQVAIRRRGIFTHPEDERLEKNTCDFCYTDPDRGVVYLISVADVGNNYLENAFKSVLSFLREIDDIDLSRFAPSLIEEFEKIDAKIQREDWFDPYPNRVILFMALFSYEDRQIKFVKVVNNSELAKLV